MKPTQSLLVSALIIAAISIHTTLAATNAQIEGIQNLLRQAMWSSSDQQGNLRLVAGAVRLSFHDCVGGCDGCINLDNPENRGLQPVIESLEPVYNEAEAFLSRADLWALAGLTAAQLAAELQCGRPGCIHLPLRMRTGRVDCSTSPRSSAVHNFTSGHAASEALFAFFRREFDLDARQSVALMGAHTLGRATAQNSGFNGPWVANQNSLDNIYYRDLVNRGWVQRPSGPDNVQWQRTGRGGPRTIMLNVDVALFKDIQPDASGRVSCGFNQCEDAATADLVRMYSNQNDLWQQDFSAALQLVVERVDVTLFEIEDTVPGEDDSSVPGDDSPTAPGDDRPAGPDGDNPTVPGGDSPTAPERGSTIAPGGDGSGTPGDDGQSDRDGDRQARPGGKSRGRGGRGRGRSRQDNNRRRLQDNRG